MHLLCWAGADVAIQNLAHIEYHIDICSGRNEFYSIEYNSVTTKIQAIVIDLIKTIYSIVVFRGNHCSWSHNLQAHLTANTTSLSLRTSHRYKHDILRLA